MNNSRRNSVIILAKNINMDKEYQNIIDYSNSELVTLCESQAHLVSKQTNYSFLKIGENRINVGVSYATCLEANYIAMQNPYYSNKWFFAFIDSVEYNSESSTIINYTIDEISTWWGYWTKKTCFVEREHVNDDTVGKHTIPEGLETGEYKINDVDYDTINSNLTTIMATTQDPNDGLSRVGKYNGIPTGVGYYRYDVMGTQSNPESNSLLYAMRQLASAGASSAIVGMFLAPKWLCGGTESTSIPVANSNDPISSSIYITKITSLDTYVPKNNKCLCFPYCFIEISNNVGQANTLYQEVWDLNTTENKMELSILGALTPGCSVRCYPLKYNGILSNMEEGISLGKFPQLNWNTDQYTNWLTQNGISIGAIKLNAEQAGILGGVSKTTAGLALGGGTLLSSGGATGSEAGLNNAIGGVGDVFSTMQESYRHSLIPNTFSGSLNCGDVITSSGTNRFFVYKKTIRKEYAQSIDDFFTRFGYKVNSLKQPNFTGRTYWNFVKIAGSEIIGVASDSSVNVPESSMDIINTVFRKGTTIWHNHSNIGNYSLNNTIVQNNS